MNTLKSFAFALLVTAFSGAGAQRPYDLPAGDPGQTSEPGLLFYLSGDHGFKADYAAGGVAEPNFNKDVKILARRSEGVVPPVRE